MFTNETTTFWLDAAASKPLLSKEETIYLAREIRKAKEGSRKHTELVNKLCEHNLRLVVKFVRATLRGKTTDWNEESVLDLLQEGYLGLRRAALKFDPERGYTFSTYANAWVRQAVGKYRLDKQSLIRVPESSAREILYYQKYGKPRCKTVAGWVPSASINAKSAWGLTSYDDVLPGTKGEITVLESLSGENVIGAEFKGEGFSKEKCYEIMEEAGVELSLRDVIWTYAKRGNMEIALAKFGMTAYDANRRKVRAEITKIQAHVGLVD